MRIDLKILDLLEKCQRGDVTCRRAAEIIEYYIERAVKEKDVSNGMTVVPIEPPQGLLYSMAMRMDHSFGAPSHFNSDEEILNARESEDFSLKLIATQDKTQREKAIILTDMKRLHEEVVGKGFYKYEY